MIRVDFVNPFSNTLSLVIKDIDARIPDGVRQATELLADDVRDHTPVKSGKARSSVVTVFSGDGRTGTVRYSYKKRDAFYMRFVLLGVKPHVISNKFRTERAQKQQAGRLRKRLEKEGRDDVYIAKRILGLPTTQKRALAFESKGQKFFRGQVRHPGIPAQRILSERLDAQRQAIGDAMRTAIIGGAVSRLMGSMYPEGSL